jgi:hypothetical protein
MSSYLHKIKMRNSMEVEGCGNYGERLFGNLLPRKTLYSGISGEKKVKEGMGIQKYTHP